MGDLSLNLSPELEGRPGYADLLIENGDLVLTSDIDPQGTNAVAQNCRQRLKFCLGEWFMNLGAGVPWLQQILVKNADTGAIDALLRDTILGTPGVAALLNYAGAADRARRIYTVKFTIRTAQGAALTQAVSVSAQGASL